MNNTSTFEEQLKLHGKILYTNVGDSMMPLIKQGRDVLIIEKSTGKLKRRDIPLYKRDSGQYVLHRVIAVKRDGYRMCGDNRIAVERGITDVHIIGVLTGIIRHGEEFSMKSLRYKLYSFYVTDLFFIRWIRFKIRALFRRIFGKAKHKGR